MRYKIYDIYFAYYISYFFPRFFMPLLVRHADDVPSATRAASELLVCQRQRCGARGENAVLGIWLTRTLVAPEPPVDATP